MHRGPDAGTRRCWSVVSLSEEALRLFEEAVRDPGASATLHLHYGYMLDGLSRRRSRGRDAMPLVFPFAFPVETEAAVDHGPQVRVATLDRHAAELHAGEFEALVEAEGRNHKAALSRSKRGYSGYGD
jgi:hypothetical protein